MEIFYVLTAAVLVMISSFLIQHYAMEKKTRVVTNSMGVDTIIPSFELHVAKTITIVVGAVIIFMTVVVITTGIVIIQPGERGVVFNVFSGISSNILAEGIHVVVPVINKVYIYDVRRQDYTMSGVKGEGQKLDDDSMWSPTREGLQVGIDITCWFFAKPDKVHLLHQKIGKNYADITVRPAIRSVLRNVFSSYSIMDVYSSKREAMQIEIFDRLKKELDKDYIVVENVLLRDVRFKPEFEKSIEEKQIAQQAAERMNYVLEKEKKEAERRVIEAEGQAKSIKIINDALSGNKAYLEYLKVNKLVENVKVMVVPSGTNTLIDLKTLENTPQAAPASGTK